MAIAVHRSSDEIAAAGFEGPHSAALASLRRWLNRHLEQFAPDEGHQDAPAVKPAVELLLILRGLRRAGANPVVAHWVDGVVSSLWDPIEDWLQRLDWASL